MFDTTTLSQKTKISAVSGTLVKTSPKSFFEKFHIDSDMADWLFDSNPKLKGAYGKFKSVVVLQVMLCGEKKLIAEIMWKDDYDEMVKSNEKM